MGVIFATGLCDGPCTGLYGAGPVSHMLHDCWRPFGRRTMQRLYAVFSHVLAMPKTAQGHVWASRRVS